MTEHGASSPPTNDRAGVHALPVESPFFERQRVYTRRGPGVVTMVWNGGANVRLCDSGSIVPFGNFEIATEADHA